MRDSVKGPDGARKPALVVFPPDAHGAPDDRPVCLLGMQGTAIVFGSGKFTLPQMARAVSGGVKSCGIEISSPVARRFSAS